jgi:hypothetical protein
MRFVKLVVKLKGGWQKMPQVNTAHAGVLRAAEAALKKEGPDQAG